MAPFIHLTLVVSDVSMLWRCHFAVMSERSPQREHRQALWTLPLTGSNPDTSSTHTHTHTHLTDWQSWLLEYWPVDDHGKWSTRSLIVLSLSAHCVTLWSYNFTEWNCLNYFICFFSASNLALGQLLITLIGLLLTDSYGHIIAVKNHISPTLLRQPVVCLQY